MELVGRIWPHAPAGDMRAAMSEPDRPLLAPAVGAAVSLDAQDDAALVKASLAGTADAFDVLVRRHQRSVYQLCYRFLGNHEDASDVAQEVFLRAFRALCSFKGGSAFTTWLYRIGVNACLNRVAARGPQTVPLESGEVAASHIDDPAQGLLRAERSRQVRAAIARLPPKQRATLILRVYHELSHQEIADAVGSSVGAAKANFFHALQNLKRLLDSNDA